jgi:predicted nucleotidyltransferase
MSDAVMTLLGVIIGALITAVPVYLQSKRQERREALRLAAEAGLKDYESRVAKDIPSSSPIIFVWLYIRLMKLIEEDALTDEDIEGQGQTQ